MLLKVLVGTITNQKLPYAMLVTVANAFSDSNSLYAGLWLTFGLIGICSLLRENEKAAKESAKAMQKQEKLREKEGNRASKGGRAACSLATVLMSLMAVSSHMLVAHGMEARGFVRTNPGAIEKMTHSLLSQLQKGNVNILPCSPAVAMPQCQCCACRLLCLPRDNSSLGHKACNSQNRVINHGQAAELHQKSSNALQRLQSGYPA